MYCVYIFYQKSKQNTLSELILKGRYFTGYITKKEIREKFIKYHFHLEYFFAENKQQKVYADTVEFYSRKEYPLFTRLAIPKIYFFQHDTQYQSTLKGMVYFAKLHKFVLKKNFFLTIKEFISTTKEKFLMFIESLFQHKNNNYFLFRTIFLGDNQQLEKNIRDLFSSFGIQHYLARSGLHIAIIIDILFILLIFLGLNSFYITIVQTIILALFYIFSYESISFFRAFMMLLLQSLSSIFHIQTTSLHILSTVSLLVLVFWPSEFLLLSTQLTFGTTAILCLINFK